jgi:hypothetical protein
MGEAFRLSVKAAKTTKPGDYCDGQGFWLVVASASARKWVFRFSFEGGIKEMGLGPVNAVSLWQARDRAQAASLSPLATIQSRRAGSPRQSAVVRLLAKSPAN